MNATDLIKFIYENEKVEDILNGLNCNHVTNRGKEFRCGLPDDTSKSRISVKNTEYLNIKIYQSEDEIIKGNIITLVMKILNIDFVSANKYIHKELGLKYDYRHKGNNKSVIQKKNPMDIFNKVKGAKRYANDDIPIHDEDSLDMFVPNLHESWIKEGILSFTARAFGIGYDFKRKRIIVPHRLWSGEKSDYIGIIGRTTISNYDMLDIPKYFPIIAYPKGMNLYGLQENYKGIQEAGYVSVFEAEKSVLKRHSRLDSTGTALMCHDITDDQVSILIGLNVEIVIVMDKGISINHIRYLCNRFYGIRKISYIWDKYDLVPNKESPADMHNDIYKYLHKYRVSYDKKEKEEYDKWVKENMEKN